MPARRNAKQINSAAQRLRAAANVSRRGVRSVAALLTAALLTLASPASAREKTRDLGPIPTNGVEAAATLPERQKRVIRELACGSESAFMDKTRLPPDKRPLEIVNAKAVASRRLHDATREMKSSARPEVWRRSRPELGRR